MKRWGGWVRGWVGLCAGLMIAGCGGGTQTPPEGETSPSPTDRVGQPPSSETPPPETSEPPGSMRWKASLGQGAVSVATDEAGNVYALVLDPAAKAASAVDVPLVLIKTDAAGKEVWRQTWTTPGSPARLNRQSLAVSPEGNIFLAYTVDCFTTPSCNPASFTTSADGVASARNAVLVKVSPSGEPTWVRSTNPANQERALGVVVNSKGATLLMTQMRDTDQVTLNAFQWDGQGGPHSLGARGLTSVAFDPEDNILVGAVGPRITKYAPEFERTLWEWGDFVLESENAVTQIGVSAKGTVVAMGHTRQDVKWGSSTLTGGESGGSGIFLVVAEADGSPRWGVTPVKDPSAHELAMAVDPSGQVVMASGALTEGQPITLFRYNLAGESLWTGSLGDTQACGGGTPTTRVTSMAMAPNHDAILGGQHAGPAKLGSVCVTGSAGFVLDLKP